MARLQQADILQVNVPGEGGKTEARPILNVASWTARRVLLHVIAETSQHAGHADIIRESIDGQKTMG